METQKTKTKPKQPDLRPEDFHWVVYGIGAGILLIVLTSVFLIIRIIDKNWTNWQLPVIMTIAYFMTVSIFAMVFSLKTIKQEMDAQQKKTKEGQNSPLLAKGWHRR